MTCTYSQSAKPDGTWNSTPRNVRLYTCHVPESPLKETMYCTGRYEDCLVCKISGLISPVPYPGILTGILNWIVNSANRSLNFVRRNIKTKITNVRETAYNSLVRPQLEYASAVWDPSHKKSISQIEQIQQRADCWTISNFDLRDLDDAH